MFNKIKSDLKVIHCFLTKNYICLLASQMQILNMYSLIESAVVRCCQAREEDCATSLMLNFCICESK